MNATTGTLNAFDQPRLSIPARITLTALALVLILPSLAAGDDGTQQVAANKPAATKTNSMDLVLGVARKSLEALKQVDDYDALFIKRERFKRKLVEQRMRIKFRRRPFSVYLAFEKPHKGREVIYVHGRNDGRMVVHLTGFQKVLGTLKVKPTGKAAMKRNRYPITDIGMTRMLEMTIDGWEKVRASGGLVARLLPAKKMDERECQLIETVVARPGGKTPFHITRLYIDSKTGLPIRVEQFGFPKKDGGKPPLLEEYTYRKVKTNVGLADLDFDQSNPEYDY